MLIPNKAACGKGELKVDASPEQSSGICT